MFHNVNIAISLHRMIATLLKRICRIDIGISGGLYKFKHILYNAVVEMSLPVIIVQIRLTCFLKLLPRFYSPYNWNYV